MLLASPGRAADVDVWASAMLAVVVVAAAVVVVVMVGVLLLVGVGDTWTAPLSREVGVGVGGLPLGVQEDFRHFRRARIHLGAITRGGKIRGGK